MKLSSDDARLLARRSEHLPGQKPLEPAPPHRAHEKRRGGALDLVRVRVRGRVGVVIGVRGRGSVRGCALDQRELGGVALLEEAVDVAVGAVAREGQHARVHDLRVRGAKALGLVRVRVRVRVIRVGVIRVRVSVRVIG